MEEIKSIKRRKIVFLVIVVFIIESLSFLTYRYFLSHNLLHTNELIYLLLIILLNLIILSFVINSVIQSTLEPLKFIWQAIVHFSPQNDLESPDINKLKTGKSFMTNLNQQLITLVDKPIQNNHTKDKLNFIFNNLPLPTLIINDQNKIIFSNQLFAKYINKNLSDILNQSLDDLTDMIFSDQENLENWINKIRQKRITDFKIFSRIKMNIQNNLPEKQFDLAVYFNNQNNYQIELILMIIDRTREYQQDDQAVSYVALSIHELRTPLTLLRGYIEIMKEELVSYDNLELKDFLVKMDATAQQLTAFVNNVLNVSRIDNDQLKLNIHPEDWALTLTEAIKSLQIRALVRGIVINLKIDPNLPLVAIDKISTIEVLSNLIDNAIKYSNNSKVINVKSFLNQAGIVETIVEDFGVGINANILEHIFTKYYRDHHNRSQIGGTGLGLYLCRSIVQAQSGSIWVNSKVNQGTDIHFTVLTVNQFKAKNPDFNSNQDFTSTAHGWIKNHSLYRS